MVSVRVRVRVRVRGWKIRDCAFMTNNRRLNQI